MRRLAITILVATTACSQRAQWTAPPAPARAAVKPAGREADRRAVTLATAAPVEGDLRSLGTLHFPVAGFEDAHIPDSFDDSRDGGARRHNAIDIMAPRGTPVLSVHDGKILRLSNSSKGGISIYTTDSDGHFVFYYAHLDRYHEGIHAGRALARGDTVGYVGTSGNAPDNVPHLHFQVMRMPRNGQYWNGEPVNPLPLLRSRAAVSSGQ